LVVGASLAACLLAGSLEVKAGSITVAVVVGVKLAASGQGVAG
jgi:hypothetical protein